MRGQKWYQSIGFAFIYHSAIFLLSLKRILDLKSSKYPFGGYTKIQVNRLNRGTSAAESSIPGGYMYKSHQRREITHRYRFDSVSSVTVSDLKKYFVPGSTDSGALLPVGATSCKAGTQQGRTNNT